MGRSRRRGWQPAVLVVAAALTLAAWAMADTGSGTATALTPPTDAGNTTFLNDVSCSATGNCSAVGGYFKTNGNSDGLLVSEIGGSWKRAVGVTLPSNAQVNNALGGSPASALSISCASAGNCNAIGTYPDTNDVPEAMFLAQTSGTWKAATAAPLPASFSTTPTFQGGNLACPATGSCVAVGNYRTGNATTEDLLFVNVGGTWQTGTALVPPAGGTDGQLAQVACSPTGSCVAVGTYDDSTGAQQVLLLTETGGTWSSGQTAPLPADAMTGSGQQVSMTGVSCPASGSCTAVGSYLNDSGSSVAMAIPESSGSWGPAVALAPPADASPTRFIYVGPVSCPTVGNCASAEVYTSTTTHVPSAVTFTEVGGTWQAGTVIPLPMGPFTLSGPNGVSCGSVGNCVVVGTQSDDANDPTAGFVITETDGTWGPAASSPLPSSSAPAGSTELNGVSCGSATDCAAVGYFTPTSGNIAGLLLKPAFGTGSGATPPTNISPPVITPGSATVGQTLTSSTGSWTGTAPLSYAYQWEDCDSTGGACTSISGATSQSYLLTASDAGHTIRVVTTATNAGGTSAPATSLPSAVVTTPSSGGGGGTPTTPASTTPTTPTPTAPTPTGASAVSAPTGVHVVSSKNGYYIVWNAVPGATGYFPEAQTAGPGSVFQVPSGVNQPLTSTAYLAPFADSWVVVAIGPGGTMSPDSAAVVVPGAHAFAGCVVPKLKGDRLKQAKKALKAANCTLGKVHKPKHLKKDAKLKVSKQSPKAGSRAATGSKVGITLRT